MKVKDKLLQQVADDLGQPLDLVESVIGWSYKNANINARSNNELEISGIGTAFISKKKLKDRISCIEKAIARRTPLDPGLEVLKEYLKELNGRNK